MKASAVSVVGRCGGRALAVALGACLLCHAAGAQPLLTPGQGGSPLAQPPRLKPIDQLAGPDTPFEAWRVRFDNAELANAYTFWLAQEPRLDALAAQVPSLAERAGRAREALLRVLGPSGEGLLEELKRRYPQTWESDLEGSRREVRDRVRQDVWNEASGTSFLAGVEGLVQGRASPEFRFPLLAFHTRYEAEPARELADGLVLAFSADGRGKSPVAMRIRLPMSWSVSVPKEGDEVLFARSKGGRGPAQLSMRVVAFDPAEVEQLRGKSPAFWQEVLSASMPGLEVLEADSVTIAGQEAPRITMRLAGVVEERGEVAKVREKAQLVSLSRMHYIFEGSHALIVTYLVSERFAEQEARVPDVSALRAEMSVQQPLFDQVLASLVIGQAAIAAPSSPPAQEGPGRSEK